MLLKSTVGIDVGYREGGVVSPRVEGCDEVGYLLGEEVELLVDREEVGLLVGCPDG
jgi:hypothetical protein